MKRTRIRKGLFLLSLASMFALGCELIVDFDRTKIPVESTETGPTGDATLPEASSDAPAGDAEVDADAATTDADAATTDATDAPADG